MIASYNRWFHSSYLLSIFLLFFPFDEHFIIAVSVIISLILLYFQVGDLIRDLLEDRRKSIYDTILSHTKIKKEFLTKFSIRNRIIDRIAEAEVFFHNRLYDKRSFVADSISLLDHLLLEEQNFNRHLIPEIA